MIANPRAHLLGSEPASLASLPPMFGPTIQESPPGETARPDPMSALTLPAGFPFPKLVTDLAEGDTMFDGRSEHYLGVGLSALRVIEAAFLDAPAPRRILDLPCGFGRVTRMLRARYPSAKITVCDLDRLCVDFTAAHFCARGVYSKPNFRELELGAVFDLIWVGSLLTHLPEHQTRQFLDFAVRQMGQNCRLIVTSHGGYVAERLQKCTYGLTKEAARGLLAQFRMEGYGFRGYSGDQWYGISLSSRTWFEQVLSGSPSACKPITNAAGIGIRTRWCFAAAPAAADGVAQSIACRVGPIGQRRGSSSRDRLQSRPLLPSRRPWTRRTSPVSTRLGILRPFPMSRRLLMAASIRPAWLTTKCMAGRRAGRSAIPRSPLMVGHHRRVPPIAPASIETEFASPRLTRSGPVTPRLWLLMRGGIGWPTQPFGLGSIPWCLGTRRKMPTTGSPSCCVIAGGQCRLANPFPLAVASGPWNGISPPVA